MINGGRFLWAAVLVMVAACLPWPALAGNQARLGHSSVAEGQQVKVTGPAKTRQVRAMAEAGSPAHQCLMGVKHERGFDVPKDYSQAARWYRRAAAQGYSMAQSCLGILYLDGRGVDQDFQKAYMWLNLATNREDRPAARKSLAKFRDNIGLMLTKDQRDEARRITRHWRPRMENQYH